MAVTMLILAQPPFCPCHLAFPQPQPRRLQLAEPTLLDEVKNWPAERREIREEKAAVWEYEDKMARHEAKRVAYEVLKGNAGE